jgi:hypothetical protein
VSAAEKLQPFRVTLSRAVAHEGVVTVWAETSKEAESVAKERADDGMIAWTETHSELDAQATAESPCRP